MNRIVSPGVDKSMYSIAGAVLFSKLNTYQYCVVLLSSKILIHPSVHKTISHVLLYMCACEVGVNTTGKIQCIK